MKINIKIPKEYDIIKEKIMKGNYYLIKKNGIFSVCYYQNDDMLQSGQLLIFNIDGYIEKLDWSENSKETLSDNGYEVIKDITDTIKMEITF